MDREMLKEIVKEVLAESGGAGVSNPVQQADMIATSAIQHVKDVFKKVMDGDVDDENVFWNAYRDSLAAYGEYKAVEAKGKIASEEKKKPSKASKPSKEEAEKAAAIQDFMERNKTWYGKDKKWTRYANTMSADLEEDPKWMYKSVDEKLQYIEDTVSEMTGAKKSEEVVELFGDKKAEKAEPKVEAPTVPMVDYGMGHGAPGDRGKVALGKESLDLLKELGLTDESVVRRFASEVNRGGNGE